jgi:beta-N-acetylhexosaminidase
VAQIAGVIKGLWQADASPLNPVRAPLLMMADQEGGEVRRLPGLPVLSEKHIGAKPLAQARTLAAPTGQGAAVIGHKLGCTNWGRAELNLLRLT